MPTLRPSAYVWVTWLSKLLVGDNSCEWAAWFKAHYKDYQKSSSNFDAISWRINHTGLLRQTRERLEMQGCAVFTEGQNIFSLKGTTASLNGKPDLISIGDKNIICDVKTGQPKESDRAQVLIYMYAVPLALPKFSGMRFDGLLVYSDHQIEIPASEMNGAFIQSLGALIRRVGSNDQARRIPAASECRFCDLTRVDCEDRIDAALEEATQGVTTDF